MKTDLIDECDWDTHDGQPCSECPHSDACSDYGCGMKLGVVDADGEEI